MLNILHKLEKLHKPLTILLLILTITLGYFLHNEYQRNNEQEKEIKTIKSDIDNVSSDIDDISSDVDDITDRVDYIEGYLNY